MRHALIGLLALFTLAGLPRPARAQHCHAPPSVPGKRIGLRIALSTDISTYRNSRYQGEYQGLSLHVEWSHRWVRVRGVLPAYRLVRNGLPKLGLGDVLLAVRVPFARTSDDSLQGGAELAVTIPSGSAADGLGMGHVMMMPGLWIAWTGARFFVHAQVAYGVAVVAQTGGTAHGHNGPAPIVNPMNASEVSAAGTVGAWAHPRLRLRGTIYGAVPVAAEAGVARAAIGVGADLVLDWLDVGLEGQLPLAGDPFTAKLLASVGFRI